MPRISEKSRNIPPSPIRKLSACADAAKARGIHVYHLNIGQPDLATPREALEAVRKTDLDILAYTHSAGIESYRRKLVRYYHEVGIDISPDELLVTVGGSEALFMAIMVCVNAGEEVLVPEPFYANYNSFAIEAGVNIKPIFSTIENDFALPPIEEFERHITPHTKAILICNPNNPTGYLYSDEELMRLRDIVLRHDLYLICDEVYREFCYDGHKHISVLNLAGAEEHAVMVDSMSKRYSMCGIRLGALVSRNREVIEAAMNMAQARLSPPLLAQIAAEAALDAPESYFKDAYEAYRERRDCLVNGLNGIPGVYCPMPKGAFYALARLPIDDCERFARWMLEEFSWKGATVMIAPATGFYASMSLGHDEARFAYVLNTDDLRAAVECLREALKCYPGTTLK